MMKYIISNFNDHFEVFLKFIDNWKMMSSGVKRVKVQWSLESILKWVKFDGGINSMKHLRTKNSTS